MTPPLALYVHLPWCIHKCAYCDFNSHATQGVAEEDRYITALLADLALEQALVTDRPLHSIFIGGGTPSLFSPAAIRTLLDGVFDRFAAATDLEITIEANPGAADSERFAGYRRAGVNRISIGVQSFNDQALRTLGRIHDRRAALSAVDAARQAGFERINLDLMYGLPGQSPAEAQADLQQALALETEHLSRYQLTLEPGTELQRNPPELPDEDAIAEMEEQGVALLEGAGYSQYEVSAYAREGGQCRHNLNYWQFGDYLGIGAGAHGKITGDSGILRRRRLADPQRYLQHAGSAAAIPESRHLSDHDLTADFMLNALRLRDGFAARLFSERTGLPLHKLEAGLSTASEQGLIEVSADWIRPTPLGQRFLNNLIELFLEDEAG